MSFVHLHVHTVYSLLDGFSNIKKLVARVKEMGMPAVAITDHGTMFGSIDFFNAANAEGIKPLIGLEGYMAPRRMYEKDARLDKYSSHLLLLAENQTGYQNLLKIASAAQVDGFYYHPRIDHEFLADHSEGLIATSGCLSAEIPRALRENDIATARQRLDWYYQVFGANNFFLELQDHPIDDLRRVNKLLLELGKVYNAKFVATNDVHYIEKSDARYQDILLAIQTGALLTDPNRMRMNDDSYYLRSPQEMQALFGHIPGALNNTIEIAERCNVDLSNKGYHLPRFDVPAGFTAETYLRELCEAGLQRKYGKRIQDPRVRERLDYELGVIHNMGFDAYFLIVWDLCMYAFKEGIWYNARGSAAGSMVAYCLDITFVEPLDHGLMFERFLNPSRISMPDIDLDFQDDRRSDLIKYCADKYGHDKVAAIITFGTLGAKAAIRDVGRVMDVPLSEVDQVSKLIPSTPSQPFTIAEALQQVKDLKDLYDSTPYLKELIDTAQHMEGVVRNVGTHAAGIVITDEPVINYVPIHRATNNSEDTPVKTVTQYEMSHLDELGLLKVDFLGLATLTIMARACAMIKARHGIDYSLENIPLDDAETFEFLGTGHTAGVFQLEGTGMTRYLVQMQPKSLAHIIAMVALYRPGPMDFIPQYIKRMHGEEDISYRHDSMKAIFNETYGIAIYQEQLMMAAMQLGGYSAAEADSLRKAISKKKAKEIEMHRAKFIQGAVDGGVLDHHTAVAIFTDWENFARYGFNKSHAADYGMIAVQTAFLKNHYPVEYMTALLSASKNDSDKVAFYVSDCRDLGIEVLPPDVNASDWDFTIEDTEEGKAVIHFGLGAVKNVGQAPVQIILDARKDGGAFETINDFLHRVDLRTVGKRALESLVKVGALDQFGDRCAILEALDRITAISASHFKAALSGQMSIFGMVDSFAEDIVLPKVAKAQTREQLEWEKELIGLYVSSHPMQPYKAALQNIISHHSGNLLELKNKSNVVVGGMVNRFRRLQTKTGKDMCFVTIEDIQGPIELVVFPKVWERFRDLIQLDRIIVVEGKIDNQGNDIKILVDSIREPLLDGKEIKSEPPTSTTSTNNDQDFGYEFTFGGDDEPSLIDKSSLEDESEELEDLPLLETSEAAPKQATNAEFAFYASNDDDDIPPPPDFPEDWFPLEAEALDDAYHLAATINAEKIEKGVEKESAIMAPNIGAATSDVQKTPLNKMIERALVMAPLESLIFQVESDKPELKMITIVLRTNFNESDIGNLRMKRVIGLLRSYHGRDHFELLILENGKPYQFDFPNDTTGYCIELLRKLQKMVGEENVQVKTLRMH